MRSYPDYEVTGARINYFDLQEGDAINQIWRERFLEPDTRCRFYILEEQKKLWSLELETYEKLRKSEKDAI